MSVLPTLSRRAIAACAILTAIAAPSPASTVEPKSLPELASAAELVFEGEVVRVAHRVSTVIDEADAKLPHTFVTFSIKRVLKGHTQDPTSITLRFMGGSNGEGKTLIVSGVPEFQVGDRDILFVKGNGKSLCPLVGSDQGRLRVVRGQVYNDRGAAVWIAADGRLASGDESIDITRVGYPDRDQATTCDHSIAPPAGARRPSAAGLLDAIELEMHSSGALGATAIPTPTADPDASFRVPAFKPSRKPLPVRGKAKAAPTNPSDDR